ncbi:alpha/beta hydrolase [Aggregatibacter aphrophilus]|uniref:alpha/beta hydrolase n=1 Tax=Aggregatibacter aphrophilus TaxID=732 RepID=UPI001CED5EB6|nr:alpha/beta hydrolase-fold protein [Aggregatibacter aphrophilus]
MKLLLFALSCTMLMNMADAHQSVSGGELKPAVLPGAKEYQLHSNFTNKDYRIQVLPVGNVKELGYSVLYVLDGDALFPAAAGMAQNMMARAEETNAVPFLIVGIGYPNTLLLNPSERSQDYTPPSENYENTGDKVNRQFGGAEHFYRFIQEELLTDLAQRFHINKSQQNIFGHSYGGLFGLYSLLNHPEGFRNYLIASPSVWWNQQRILQDLPSFIQQRSKQAGQHIGVRFSVVEYEQKLAPYKTGCTKAKAVGTTRHD